MATDLVLPTFVVIGAMKAGTTTLYELLRAHPSVFMSNPKEPEFFSEEAHWRRGVPWYASLFQNGAEFPARGEASTGYTRAPRFPLVASRMAEVLPGVRLLYLVRDPVERMCSHHRHSVLAGRERRPLATALVDGDGYLQTSQYGYQLSGYLDHFPAHDIQVVFTENLRSADTLRKIDRFIGVNPDLRAPSLTGEAHHVSERRVRVPRPLRALGTRPGTSALAQRFPRLADGTRSVIGRRPAAVDERLDAHTRRYLIDRLADDLELFESQVGPLPASWRQAD